jgi:L-ascorbate metabolism protein UlaG (beta-lactamase superfamily)
MTCSQEGGWSAAPEPRRGRFAKLLRLAIVVWVFLLPAFPQQLRVVHMANAGVLLDCGGRLVAIDLFFREGVKGYETLSDGLREALESAQAPYDRIELILATHVHADHFDAASVARHLSNNPQARFAGTEQTAAEVRRLIADRVEQVTRPAQRRWDDIDTTFVRVRHNRPLPETLENTLHVVRWCGSTVAVTGDAEMDVSAFQGHGFEQQQIDTLVAPWWFFVNSEGRQVVEQIFRPRTVWGVHGNVNNPAEWEAQIREHYPRASIGFGDAPLPYRARRTRTWCSLLFLARSG